MLISQASSSTMEVLLSTHVTITFGSSVGRAKSIYLWEDVPRGHHYNQPLAKPRGPTRQGKKPITTGKMNLRSHTVYWLH